MTVRKYIMCPTCDCVFLLKLQVDHTIYKGWHLRFVCPDCGELIDIRISDNLDKLKYSVDAEETITSGYILGYNPILPNSKINYFSHFENEEQTMIALGVFMALDYSQVEIHNSEVAWINTNVSPYSDWLKSLLPMINTNNTKAFTRKLSTLIGNDHNEFKEIGNPISVFDELIYKVYQNFVSKRYLNQVSPLYRDYQDKLISANYEVKMGFKQELAELGIVLGKWKRESAYQLISDYVNKVGDYIQSLFYFNNGSFEIPHNSQLYTTTISIEAAMSLYAQSFECYMKVFPFMIAITNFGTYGSFDDFGADNPQHNSIQAFCKLSSGTQIELICNSAHPANSWLLSALSNDIRNGKTHDSFKYDSVSQMVSIYDNNDDLKIIHKESLFDICHRTHILVLHIIEALRMGNFYNKLTQE